MKVGLRMRIHFFDGIARKFEYIVPWHGMYAFVVHLMTTSFSCSNDGENTLLDFETVEDVVL